MSESVIEIKAVITPIEQSWLSLQQGQFFLSSNFYQLEADYTSGPNSIRKKYDIQKIHERYLVFKHIRIEEQVVAWSVSPLLFVGNLVHNVFIKCLFVLLVTLFSTLLQIESGYYRDKSFTMLSEFSPIKALLITVPQMMLNCIAFFAFGFGSKTWNRLGGRLERWAVGDTEKEVDRYSLARRCNLKFYLAPCQQPICVLKEGVELPDNHELKIHQAISSYALRFFLPQFMTNGRCIKAISEDKCHF